MATSKSIDTPSQQELAAVWTMKLRDDGQIDQSTALVATLTTATTSISSIVPNLRADGSKMHLVVYSNSPSNIDMPFLVTFDLKKGQMTRVLPVVLPNFSHGPMLSLFGSDLDKGVAATMISGKDIYRTVF